MSSVLKAYAVATPTTKFMSVKSFTYFNSVGGNNILMPFSYANGVLDIDAIPGFSTTNGAQADDTGVTWRQCKMMGGFGLVQSLGPTFVEWFINWLSWEDDITVDAGSVEVHIPGVMTKVHQVDNGDTQPWLKTTRSITYGITEAPASTEFTTGTAADNYNTMWIFKHPLVVKYTTGSGANTYYASLNSQITKPGAY